MSTLGSVVGRGLLAARPAAGIAGQLYGATDTSIVYRDNGASWDSYAALGVVDPTTTRGDILVRNNAGALVRLALGAANTLLHGSATDPSYSAVVPADMDVTADNTTADVTTGHHGLFPKLPGGTTNFWREDGSWQPASGGGGATPAVNAAGRIGAYSLFR